MDLGYSIQRVLKEKHRHKKRLQAVAMMMVLVMSITIYSLILPAVAPEKKALCGKEEHLHTDACYGENVTLICGMPQNATHKHDATCFAPMTQKTQVCT